MRKQDGSTNIEVLKLKTGVHYRHLVCGFSLHDQFWITNGTTIKPISDDLSSSVIQLPFRFFDGVCKTFGYDKIYKAWMCFARGGTNQCQSFDGLSFVPEVETSYGHSCANSLGSYNGNPFITGSSENVKTEIFSQEDSRWTLSADFPYASNS